MKLLQLRMTVIIDVVLITFLLTSCHLLYLPNELNAPMLTEKSDISGNISGGLSNLNLQAAFSPVNNIGLMLNYAGGKTTNKYASSNTNKYNFLELGLGYYLPLDKIFLIDVYGGFGIGEAYTFDNSFNSTLITNGKYSRVFFQPSFTISVSDAFDANFAIRPVLLFMEKTTNQSIPTQSNSLFFEPVITLKYGWKYVKIINQLGVSLPVKPTDFGFNPFIISVGLNFQLKPGWKTRNDN